MSRWKQNVDREIWEEFYNRWDLLFEMIDNSDANVQYYMTESGEDSEADYSEVFFERKGKVALRYGYLTITQEYKVKIASKLMKQADNLFIAQNFIRYDGELIIMPTKFLPDKELLNYHNQERFLG